MELEFYLKSSTGRSYSNKNNTETICEWRLNCGKYVMNRTDRTDAVSYYLNPCLINFICPLHDHVQFHHDSYLMSRYFDFYYKFL